MNKRKDIIIVYQNCPKRYHYLSLEQFFYRVFVRNALKKSKKDDSDEDHDADAVTNNDHRILVPKGMNCIPRYPVDFAYAQRMLIFHKTRSKDNTLTRTLKDHQKTINTFLTIIDKKEVLSSVTFKYHTAMKNTRQKRLKYLLSRE